MYKEEIILYQPDDKSIAIDVRVEDETVWLTQAQMAELFKTTRNNITLHISNVFKEKELYKTSVCKDSLLTAKDGKKYKTKLYSLDVIISVGYRVKSQRGTQFRIWANKVIKDYLLKGYAVNHRMDRIENDVHYLKEKVNEFDLQIKTNMPPNEGIFYDGQIFDAYQFVSKLIKSANKSIILIDNYIDETVLLLLSKRKKEVNATVYTAKINDRLKLDIQKFNEQYSEITIRKYTKSHDRFLIIDKKSIYHIGASLKDLGKKWFVRRTLRAFSKINLNAHEIINKLSVK